MDELHTLIFFAQQMTYAEPYCGWSVARSRGWLTDDGSITETGREVANALIDQRGTRSVLRI